MALFRTDSLFLVYTNLQAARQWWIDTFDCKPVKIPDYWENSLPSDVALKLPGFDEPTVVLTSQDEAQAAHLELPTTVPVLFVDEVKKAQGYLTDRGVVSGPVQDDGETEFFEIRDTEGHVIEICKEP